MGSIWSFLTPKGRCRPFALNECDLNCWDGNISTFSDRFLRISRAGHNFDYRNSRVGYCLRTFRSGTGYHFQESDSGTG